MAVQITPHGLRGLLEWLAPEVEWQVEADASGADVIHVVATTPTAPTFVHLYLDEEIVRCNDCLAELVGVAREYLEGAIRRDPDVEALAMARAEEIRQAYTPPTGGRDAR